MEAAIRFNQNSLPGTEQLFLKVDVAGKAFHLNEIKEIRQGKVIYDNTGSATKLPNFRAFDWHPTTPSLVAIGQTGGDAGIADLTNDKIALNLSVGSPRSCNAVALRPRCSALLSSS